MGLEGNFDQIRQPHLGGFQITGQILQDQHALGAWISIWWT
jgi:hypothetical protein